MDSEQPDLRLGWIPTPTAAWTYRVEGACMDVEAGRPGDAAVAECLTTPCEGRFEENGFNINVACKFPVFLQCQIAPPLL